MLLLTALPFLAVVVLLNTLSPQSSGQAGHGLPSAPSAGLSELDPPREGKVVLSGHRQSFDAADFRNLIGSYRSQGRLQRASGARMFRDDMDRVFMVTAAGLDYQHHPANAFLTGTVPYRASGMLEPYAAVAQRLRYQLDDRQFGGAQEVWETSGQAWERMRGDCEDHAILLADWLIDSGYDARVVLGNYKGGGHAWVVLFVDAQVYLLEATSKAKRRRYPLARFETQYHPSVMFNRDRLWVNEGSHRSTNYQSRQWRLAARFQAS